MNSTEENPTTLENKFVAYIDILGFSNIITRMEESINEGDNGLFLSVKDVLKTIEDQSKRVEDYRNLCNRSRPPHRASFLPHANIEATAFSDCYLLSDTSSLGLLAAVQTLASNLLRMGILTRGAIVFGKIYHKGRIAFGSAFNKAYLLESNVSKYPRIIIADSFYGADRDDKWVDWGGSIFQRDIDGFDFINMLLPPLSRWEPVLTDVSMTQPEFLKHIGEHLRKMLQDADGDLRKLSKLRWLAHYFNIAAKENRIETIQDISSFGSE